MKSQLPWLSMSAITPDYDSDPQRTRAFQQSWQEDIHGPVADRLVAEGLHRVLDIGSGIGRFAPALGGRARWIGLDQSPRQLADCPHRPVVRADATQLPVGDRSVDAVTMLWMLYHLDDPRQALAEGHRVLRDGGLLVASATSRRNDPELVPEGFVPSTFDAEDAPEIVGDLFGESSVEVERWDEPLVHLGDRDEGAAYARSHLLPPGVCDNVTFPLTLTKRGCLVWARRR